ncbi:MAG: adenylate/guanylate cyclase domain-containing protein [Bacteroidetes bacterium]|nr:MAG: adenylate/guanylate cyclase domain-containing protein [Bacteroidota bacterium]REK08148.1 MAG: adenylate/guanylate cyclase domain-containing protein [Bacteroidota bacterium]REK32353.1 MAG: adenylate/guanylate cyclase domain-containing protein [Bacteroidota bacterium]REK49587.1 MAG: adenylate/guanylate cyclase domain-containing protein [Bacteroidota bacterium]
MINLIKRLFTLLFLFLSAVSLHAQDPVIDSLRKELDKANSDTLKIDILNAISKNYFNTDPNMALVSASDANQFANRINYQKGEALALKNMGIAYYLQAKYLETLEYWEKAKAVYDSIGDEVGVANMLNNEGAVYFNQGDDTKALELYLKSLKISEKLGDTLRILTALQNIGAVYANKSFTHDKALDYYHRALPLSEAIKDNDAIGTVCVNLGEIYFKKDKASLESSKYTKSQIDSLYQLNDSLSLYYFEKSRVAFSNSENLPASLNFIGKVYARRGDYPKAISYQKEAIQIARNLDARLDVTQALIGLGDTYYLKGEIPNSISSYHEAEKISRSIGGTIKELKDAYGGLALAYAKQGDYRNAYQYRTWFSEIKDTLYNIDTDKKLSGLQFNFDIQKKQGQIDLLTKDKELQELDLKKQKLIKNVTFGGLTVVMMFLGIVFMQKKKIAKEKARSEELLLNILPSETAEELKATGSAKAKSFDMVTVMFTDFKNFTQASEKLSAEELVKEINYCYSEFDKIITRYGIEKIKTIGDSYMCAGGIPVVNSTHAVDVIKAGLEMQEFILKNKEDRIKKDQPYFELRLGIHTGPVVAGIVGIKKFAYDIWGDTVNTASRMESSGEVGKVNISGETYALVKDDFECIHRGKIKAKNKGEIDMYFVEGIKNKS